MSDAVPLRSRQLTAQSAVKLFARFYRLCGAEECLNAFGWDDGPQGQLYPSETVYEFSVPGAVVGFGAIQLDAHRADDDEAMLTCGVFPKHRRQGYWRAIMAWLADRAKDLGADVASQIVFKANTEHYARVKRSAMTGGSWIHAGDVWYPSPGYGYFVLPLDDGGTEKEDDA